MADEQNTATVDTSNTSKESTQQTAPSYSVQEFKQNSMELFGVHPEVIDGALHGGDVTQEYTVDEMKAKIKEFLEKPLKDGEK
jgi:hypothetical protein